jgi:hypothetical protein
MRIWPVLALAVVLVFQANAQQAQQPRLENLEKKLDQALEETKRLNATVESLREELAKLKQQPTPTGVSTAASARNQQTTDEESKEFAERIIGPDLGSNVRDDKLEAKPEIFIQTRYSAAPINGSGSAFQPNLRLSRIETRWAGRVADRLGAGFEIQFQESVEGSPEKLVNDAFIEYYATDHVTVRMGQFIKPFGFNVEQSSVVRESPERSIFSGYFFPGERDRGILLFGDFGFLPGDGFRDLQYFIGAFNGNRFFNDSNRQVNYMARVRKIFAKKFAVGVSTQLGKQLLPPAVNGNDNERVFGIDFQYTAGRFGLRGEALTGNMPSTRPSIQPDFFPAFRPGAHSSAAELFVGYRILGRNNVYARYNQFNGDPTTGLNVRAFNIGYFRPIGQLSRLSIDYQYKNRPSFEDDAINGRLQITWGLLLGKQPGDEMPR